MYNLKRIILILPFLLASIVIHTQSTSVSSTEYNEVIDKLKDHILGDVLLSNAEFENNHDLLLDHISVLSSDTESIVNSFELLELFDTEIGPLFVSSNTQNGFNRAYASDGFNLHRNIMLIHQGIVDHSFIKAQLESNPSILDGKYFQTSSYFPGMAESPQDPETIETATVKCSYQLAKGSQPWGEIGNPNVIRPTGCYLAPGSIGEITVPEALIGQGIKIRVGAHFWNLENKSKFKRMDRVSITYDIDAETIKVANPLGGGLYLEVPLGVDEGIVEIALKNVIRSPFYSKKTFHETTLSEWQDVERKHPAPWTDFETDRFMMQVPTSWIYNFDDPQSLLEDWDKSMDVVSDLLGRPRIVDRHKNYLQFDVIIRGSAYHPGYPMSNTPYNPYSATDGTPQHNILKGPQFNQDIHFHELGHEVAITKFVGETEAIVNFLYVPVLNKCFGYSLGESFQKSFGPSYNYYSSKDNTTRTRLVAETFHAGIERNTCNCTKNEVRYQHRGYAHYVDIVELYGWEALERFWQSEGDAADMGNPFPVNNQEQDDRIFRMSKAAGVDLRPLFHFWGIIPHDQDDLVHRMEEENLKLPMGIKQKLHQYKTLIPSDYDDFVDFGNELYPDFLDYSGSQFDFGAGWYQATAGIYDEDRAAEIQNALSDIIILYYGTDCFELEEFTSAEFTLEGEYCRSNTSIELPSTSLNGIEGSWFPDEINTSEEGQFEYVFTPNLEECALEETREIDINEISMFISGLDHLCYGSSTALFASDEFESYTWSVDGEVVSNSDSLDVDQMGTIGLIVIDANGCVAEAETEVTIEDEIDISIVVNHPPCYLGLGSASFEPVGGNDLAYTYSMEGDALYAGVYMVTAFDSLGCHASFEFEVVQPDTILIDLIDGELVVSGGTAPYFISMDTVGNAVNVNVVDSNDCDASIQFMLTSIQEDKIENVNIFPNPVSEKLYLDLGDLNSRIRGIELITIDGSKLKSFSSSSTELDVSEIHNGIYILKISLEDGRILNSKILVIHF